MCLCSLRTHYSWLNNNLSYNLVLNWSAGSVHITSSRQTRHGLAVLGYSWSHTLLEITQQTDSATEGGGGMKQASYNIWQALMEPEVDQTINLQSSKWRELHDAVHLRSMKIQNRSAHSSYHSTLITNVGLWANWKTLTPKSGSYYTFNKWTKSVIMYN